MNDTGNHTTQPATPTQTSEPIQPAEHRPTAPISVLMSLYSKSNPVDLTWTLGSLQAQSLLAEQVVIVFDGPVSDEIKAVVKCFVAVYPALVTVVNIEVNGGLAMALNHGLELCEHALIARLDSDDIAEPQRFAEQYDYLTAHPEVDVLGTAIREFDDAALNAALPVTAGDFDVPLERLAELHTTVRSRPETHAEIARAAKMNSPVNHPAAIIRKDALNAVGGYRHVHLMEDYDLWARLIAEGYTLHNLPQPLTWFRTSDAMFRRRSGHEMFAAERQMQANLVRYGLVSRPRALFNLTARSTFRLLPKPLLRRAYRALFQRK